MIPKKQLSSYVRVEEDTQGGTQSRVLDLSKKQLRKINQIDLGSLFVDKIDLSYNFLKSLAFVNIVENQNQSYQQQSTKKPNSQQQPQQHPPPALTWLDISFNVIDTIDTLPQQLKTHLRQLEYLNACTNKIQTVNLSDKTYPYLKQLHLKNNNIKFFLHCPQSLQVLTLDKNQLKEIAFTGGKNLEILSAEHNKIDKIAIQTPQLTFLDLQDNEVFNLETFYQFLSNTKKILSVNMIDNPIDFNKNYKITLLSTCPKIVQIDEVYINPHVREGFRILREEEKLQEVLEKTTLNYQKRLEQQLKYKEQMMEKLKLQEREIEGKFLVYCQRQKEEMVILQQNAKNTLGKHKFKIAEEKDEFENKIQSLNTQASAGKKDKKLLVEEQQIRYRNSYDEFKRQSLQRNRSNNNNQTFKVPQQQGSSLFDAPIQQQQSEKGQLKSPQKRDEDNRKPLRNNTYRENRKTIAKKGKMESLQTGSKRVPVKFPEKPIELRDVIDMRCIAFLKSQYRFYE